MQVVQGSLSFLGANCKQSMAPGCFRKQKAVLGGKGNGQNRDKR